MGDDEKPAKYILTLKEAADQKGDSFLALQRNERGPYFSFNPPIPFTRNQSPILQVRSLKSQRGSMTAPYGLILRVS